MRMFNRVWFNVRRYFTNWAALNRSYTNLWLDDVRPAPRGWYHATSVEEALDILKNCFVFKCSLDHDLGLELTGYDLGKEIVRLREECGLNIWPLAKPTIHSQNPPGARNMREMIDRWGPYNFKRGKR